MIARGLVDQFTTPLLSALEVMEEAMAWVSDLNGLRGDEREQAVRMANLQLDRADAFFEVLCDAATTPHPPELCSSFARTREAFNTMFQFVREGAPESGRFRHVPIRDALRRWHPRERQYEMSLIPVAA